MFSEQGRPGQINVASPGKKRDEGRERDNFRMHGVVRPEDTARENNSFLDGEMPEAGANGTGNIFTGRT